MCSVKRILVAAILALTLFACGSSDRELFDTARFEEQQNNRENAVKLYKEIVRKHPESPYRAKAEERLRELEQKKQP